MHLEQIKAPTPSPTQKFEKLDQKIGKLFKLAPAKKFGKLNQKFGKLVKLVQAKSTNKSKKAAMASKRIHYCV